MDLAAKRKTFLDPPPENRPAPFWFWNDHLDPKRLIEQYDLLVDAGMGGACMHARSGLDSEEYLDETWFEAARAVVDHARERGKKVWIYDELGWPSGTAGGRVTRAHPELRAMHLILHDVTPSSEADFDDLPDESVAAFIVTKTDPEHGLLHRKDRGSPMSGAVTLLPDRIAVERLGTPLDRERLAGCRLLLFESRRDGGTIDYLDRRGAEAFLESTHEEYYRRFGGDFGTTLTHTFMDEAGMHTTASSVPWTERFLDIFSERRGYDLCDRMPALFFEVPGHEKVRFDFWSLATELFREGFGVPMNEWCENHGIHYSGHYVFETTLKEATRQLGSTMPLYEHQGMPGIDTLGNDFYSRRFSPEDHGMYTVMVKQAASVVHQLGKVGLMSEAFGVGGHACGPEDMQTAANWQMALGVTFIAQHAPFYSMRGKRKYDHPPIIGWQQPYWPFVNKHIDALSRTGWLLSQGKHMSDVLLLHPQASMQATYRQFRTRDEYKAENYVFDADMPFELVDKHITLLTVALLDAQIDFDYGDEELMAAHGSVDDGSLRVGEMSYSTVVVPPSINMRSTTLARLREFAQAGGAILTVGSVPCLVDGEPSDEARAFFDENARGVVNGVDHFDYRGAVDAISDLGGRTVTALDADGKDVPQLKVHRRRWDGCEIVYLANISRDAVEANVALSFDVDGVVEEWAPASGETGVMAACVSGAEMDLDLAWHPRQARAFVARPGSAETASTSSYEERSRVAPDWAGERTGPNALVLDECHLVEGGEPGELLSVSEVQELLADAPSRRVTSRHPIAVASEIAEGAVSLACEFGSRPRVSLNGAAASLVVTGSMLDPAMQTIDLPALSLGENSLQIEGTYDSADAFQNPFLLGEFDVHTEDGVAFTVAAPADSVAIGSWPEKGLPFYAGTVVYRATVSLDDPLEGDRVMLEMPGLAGSAEVRVNGEVVDHVLWPPYAVDVTRHMRSGENEIEIEVANTLRNLYGAHFNYNEEVQAGISIASHFAPAGSRKQFMDYGLLAPPEIVILAAR